MQLISNILLALLFIAIPLYYIMSFSATYYKKVYSNKSNIKYSGKIKSTSIYVPVILLAISTILFTVSNLTNIISIFIAAVMLVLTVIVFSIIVIIGSKFYVFDKYLVLQNDAIEFKEIKTIFIKDLKKKDTVEIKIYSKADVNTCKLSNNDSKAFVKQLRALLPKNIKITEA